MLAAFAAILMAASIMLSGSRSGTFSLFVELVLLFLITITTFVVESDRDGPYR